MCHVTHTYVITCWRWRHSLSSWDLSSPGHKAGHWWAVNLVVIMRQWRKTNMPAKLRVLSTTISSHYTPPQPYMSASSTLATWGYILHVISSSFLFLLLLLPSPSSSPPPSFLLLLLIRLVLLPTFPLLLLPYLACFIQFPTDGAPFHTCSPSPPHVSPPLPPYHTRFTRHALDHIPWSVPTT